MKKQLRAPASGALRAAFLRFFARERGGHDARNRGFGLASYSRGLVFLRETLQAQRAEDWCSQRGTLQTQMLNEATDGLAPSVLDSFEKPRVQTRVLLPRPGAPSRGHYRPKEPRAGVPRRGHCRPTNVQRGYGRVGTVDFCHFSGAVRADFPPFPPTSEERPDARNHGSDSRRVPNFLFSRTGILQAQIPTRRLTLLSNTPQTKCIFWQPPSHFSPWSPSSFAMDDVPYTCAEQYMMA